MATAVPPLREAITMYAFAPWTAVHCSVTGEVRLVAPSAGETMVGVPGFCGQAVVVNLKCGEAMDGQLSKIASTHHSIDEPGTVASSSVSVVEARRVVEPLAAAKSL